MQRTYSRDEVRKASLAFFSGDELATDVYVNKYALKDHEGNYYELSPAYSGMRLAKEFAKAELKYANPMSVEEIYRLLMNVDTQEPLEGLALVEAASGFGPIVPQGSPQSAMGNFLQIQSLSNCFVIDPPHDSYGGILHADQEQAQIMKRRGGVGMDLSTIRPRGLPTSNAAMTTDGIGVFMQRFSNTCREVAQGGRRGALMLTISINHPEIETFINIKRDKTAVTGANISIRYTDEFMRAVESDSEYTLRWPCDVDPENAKIVRVVRARDIWDQVIDAAWFSAEPGVLFWDAAQKYTPSERYASKGFAAKSTNPCLTYDTKLAVADGRGYVEIGELAKTGFDVPVYAVDECGKIVVKMMRHPRLTGEKMPVFKVTIEGGHSFKATGNHKMIMRDGTRIEVKDLKTGDQLWSGFRASGKFHEAIKGLRATQSQDYYWINDCENASKHWKSEHRLIWEYHNQRSLEQHEVIHHIDFNAQNNHIDNLRCMLKEDHDALHTERMCGNNNPIFKIKANPVRFAEYSKTLSDAVSGLNNPMAYAVSSTDVYAAILSLTKRLNRRPSLIEWQNEAKQLGMPINLTKFRCNELGGSFAELCRRAATEVGVSNPDVDPRMQRTLCEAEAMGYIADVIDNDVYVERTCEWCKQEFLSRFSRREIAFCSHSCSNLHANRIAGKNTKRTATLQKIHAKKSEETRKKILDKYTSLRFELGRMPNQPELVQACRSSNIPFRYGLKNGFKDWQDVTQTAQLHNHRIVSVEPCGFEDVYNGTVDDEHTLCIAVGDEKIERFAKNVMILLGCTQCGEIVLSAYDSCRLQVVDLRWFVKNKWMPDAKFDFAYFDKTVQIAQRLMDDLVDLEIEAVERIIAKINADPEPEYIKAQELSLWSKIKNAAAQGRRTGLGITALGDTLAMLGLKYGSPESIAMTDAIYRALALASYRSSVKMAQDRGAFPAYDYELEKDDEFINRIMNLDDDLRADWKKFGRRNIANTTTAPVGSMSTQLASTSGIENVPGLKSKRRRKINPSDPDARVDYTDALGDKWQWYDVHHRGLQQWIDATGETDITKSPYWGTTINDVDWVSGVKLQAAAQKWVCHSISRTANLPKDATHELVSQVYLEAWRHGCKGFTVYRDGSRANVLLVGEEAKVWFEGIPDDELVVMLKIADRFKQHMPDKYLQTVEEAKVELQRRQHVSESLHANMIDDIIPTWVQASSQGQLSAPRRPKRLPCHIHRVKVMVNGESETYLALVGLMEDKPYEIFCGLSKHVDLPRKFDKGTLVKNGRKKPGNIATYNLIIPTDDGEEIVFKDVVELFDNPNYGSFSRVLSLVLRHQIPLHFLVEQLQKDKYSDISSWARAIARVLKQYIPDGTKASLDKVCPQCNSDSLIYQSGCPSCSSCGWTKCA
jgi:ribonucleotide reductase alpha subunit